MAGSRGKVDDDLYEGASPRSAPSFAFKPGKPTHTTLLVGSPEGSLLAGSIGVVQRLVDGISAAKEVSRG